MNTLPDKQLPRNQHCIKLNHRLDIGVIRHIALEHVGVRRESRDEVFKRVEQEMAHRDIGGFAAWNDAAEALFHGNPFETRMRAQEANGHRHVRFGIVSQIEPAARSVWVEDADFYHCYGLVMGINAC